MKTRTIVKMFMLIFVMGLFSCSMMPSAPDDSPMGDVAAPGDTDAGGDDGEGNGQNDYAGRVTAGEWNDLANWDFWSNLVNGQEYGKMPQFWGYYTGHRVAVRITDNGVSQAGVPLQLLNGKNEIIWEAVTNNKGEANLWAGLYDAQYQPDSLLSVRCGTATYAVVETPFNDSVVVWNELVYSAPASSGIDIAFIVDATGSMGDEISFLKSDLQDILNKVDGTEDLQTAALFYRDEGDDYVTKVSDFTARISKTIGFIGKQEANGGGDYPEAVHTALTTALQELSWRENARVKLAFMLLDAPPHYQSDIVQSIHQSNRLLAKQGIRMIPIAASGVDKNTEFLLRFLAMTTDGTYVFITNDSGIGNDHIEASVGEYEVELLNELMVRLINEYVQ